MNSPYEELLYDIKNLKKRLDLLGCNSDFSKEEDFLGDLIKNQYSTEVMLNLLETEIYPPYYILNKIKYMDKSDNDFERLFKALDKACRKTSMMWKQSNMNIFDWLDYIKNNYLNKIK